MSLQLEGSYRARDRRAGHAGLRHVQGDRGGGRQAIRSDLASRGKVDIALDVTKEEDWKAAMAEIGRTHGRLDGLVNNAGIGTPGDVEQTPFSEWRSVMAVNADGVFLGCKYAMPLLAKSKAPSIVNISSASGIVGGANLAAYNASKGAVRLLTKSVALSGARKRPPVRCNSVHPAFIEGDMVDAWSGPPRPGQGPCQAGRPGPHRPPRPAARGGQHGGVAAVGGLLLHDRLRGPRRRRPDCGVNAQCMPA